MKHLKPAKTSACRLLDSMSIAYELRPYEVDLNDLTALSVARKINLPAEQVFKTLVTHTQDGEYLFAVVPGDSELDLKKLATAAGTRNAELAALKDVEPLTGYVRGGVTVLSARKAFRAFGDDTLELFDVISVSSGQRGLQIVLAPSAYVRAASLTLADLTRATPGGGAA